MNTDKDDVRNILLADVPWIDQRDVILAMLSAAHAKGREEGFQVAVKALSDNMENIIATAIERLLEKKP